jgi:hypothetical protein
MKKLLANLFYPEKRTFTYNGSREIIIQKIQDLFSKGDKFLSGPDIDGSFIDGDIFKMQVYSSAITKGVGFGSTLFGKITNNNDGSLVELEATASSSLKFLFFLAIFLGIAYMYLFFRTSDTAYLYSSIGMTLIGPALSIFMAGVSNEAIFDRYIRYIDKELKQQLNVNKEMTPGV